MVNGIVLSVLRLNVLRLNGIMLSVLRLSVLMLNGIVLSVLVLHNVECFYADFRIPSSLIWV